VNELTVAEAAYLAALPKAPRRCIRCATAIGPSSGVNYVVDRLLENGWIKQADADKARKDALAVTSRTNAAHNFCRRVFCRGSPPRRVRALRRKETL